MKNSFKLLNWQALSLLAFVEIVIAWFILSLLARDNNVTINSKQYHQVYSERCKVLLSHNAQTHKGKSGKNPRSRLPGNLGCLTIRNCTIWDGIGNIMDNMDIRVQDGVIKQITHTHHITSSSCPVIEAHGRIVTPGLIDAHSHAGLATWPHMAGNDDVNEESDPSTHQMRSLDAFNPHDHSFHLITTGGVTTSLILPVS